MEYKNYFIAFAIIAVLFVIMMVTTRSKSSFSNILNEQNNFSNVNEQNYCGNVKEPFSPTLVTPESELTNDQPRSFDNNFIKPTVKEEIGFSMLYPQGAGVYMSSKDTESFSRAGKDILLTSYSIPESYGESSFNDPTGQKSAKIIDISNSSVGVQNQFKPTEFMSNMSYPEAYSNGNKEFVNIIDYNDQFVPESNILLQNLPGRTNTSTEVGCDTNYPQVVKYNDSCITSGDIPYGTSIDLNGKKIVNPRLISRWESYTGNYDVERVLDSKDGLLFPKM